MLFHGGFKKKKSKRNPKFMVWAIALMLMLFSVVGKGGERWHQWTLGKDVHEVSSVCVVAERLREIQVEVVLSAQIRLCCSTNNMNISVAGDAEVYLVLMLDVYCRSTGSRKLHLNIGFHGLRSREEQKEPGTGSQSPCSKWLNVECSHFLGQSKSPYQVCHHQ